MNGFRFLRSALLLAICQFVLNAPANADDISKENNATDLNLLGSWVGPSAPDSNDVAVWDSNVTANRTTLLGADLAWKGIKVTDAGGTVMTVSAGNTLSLGSGGIDMSLAEVDFRFRPNIILTADQNWTIASGRILEIMDTGFSITGAFDVYASGPGSLSFRNSAGFTDPITNLHLGGDIALITSGGPKAFLSTVTIEGNLSVGPSGAGTPTFNFYGNNIIAAGTHTLTLKTLAAGDLAARFGSDGTTTSGPGTLSLQNGNAFPGEVHAIIGGTGLNTSFQADLTIGENVRVHFNESNQMSNSSDLTVESGGFFSLGNLANGLSNQTIRSLSGTGTVDHKTDTPGINILTIDGGFDTDTATFSGDVVNDNPGGGGIGITKLGQTTQIFSGDNVYIGRTYIGGGKLLINGTHIDESEGPLIGSGWGDETDGHFVADNGGTLGGTGRIAGDTSAAQSNMVLIKSGGRLAPGASMGTFTLDGVNFDALDGEVLHMADGANLDFELAGDGSIPDRIDFWNYEAGDVRLDDVNGTPIHLTLSGAIVEGTYTVSIVRFFEDDGVTATTSGILAGLALGNVAGNIVNPSIDFNEGGSTIDITYTVVPEPGTFLLLTLALSLPILFRSSKALRAGGRRTAA